MYMDARKMKEKGKTIEGIAELTGLDRGQIERF
jgi:hypothetical protein